jgi:hypothetical protein
MRCPSCHRKFHSSWACFAGYAAEGAIRSCLSQRSTPAQVLLSLLAAWGLLWVTNIRKLFYPSLGVEFGFLASLWLGFPVAFLILTVKVRNVSRVISPTQVLRHWGPVTTLNLTDETTEDMMTGGAIR